MTNDFYDFDDRGGEVKGRGHLFLWTVFILLLIAFAFACWLGSFYVFGHPEQAKPYEILMKLHKLEPPKRFEITAAPPGEFLTAKKLFERYSKLSPLQLQNDNAELLRIYIKNYRETKARVPYATGRFEIVSAYELQPTDLFSNGMVALAVSVEHPQVMIEHIYPSALETVPRLRALLQPGLELKLERTYDIAAVLNASRTDDGRFIFTLVPLTYGNYVLKQGVGTFSLEPPMQLNVAAGVPIVRGKVLQDAMQAYAEIRRARRSEPDSQEQAKSSEPELVRLDEEKEAPQAATPMPVAPAPLPPATPRNIASRMAKPTPPLVAMNASPKPRAATPIPVATPIAATSPSGVPLKPFISSIPGQDPRHTAARWPTFTPGQQPPGRTLTVGDALPLAERGDLSGRTYLRGSFVVTASGDNWAVLRSQGGKSGPGAARVIVQYPASATPPPPGSTFSRDESRAFQVQDVHRSDDGQVNINVREVTQP